MLGKIATRPDPAGAPDSQDAVAARVGHVEAAVVGVDVDRVESTSGLPSSASGLFSFSKRQRSAISRSAPWRLSLNSFPYSAEIGSSDDQGRVAQHDLVPRGSGRWGRHW